MAVTLAVVGAKAFPCLSLLESKALHDSYMIMYKRSSMNEQINIFYTYWGDELIVSCIVHSHKEDQKLYIQSCG